MNQTGTIYAIGVTEQVTEKLRKRELILEVSGQYPQYLKFEAKNDKCEMLDNFRKGQSVDISFNLNGRLYKDTAFNSLDIWKIA